MFQLFSSLANDISFISESFVEEKKNCDCYRHVNMMLRKTLYELRMDEISSVRNESCKIEFFSVSEYRLESVPTGTVLFYFVNKILHYVEQVNIFQQNAVQTYLRIERRLLFPPKKSTRDETSPTCISILT